MEKGHNSASSSVSPQSIRVPTNGIAKPLATESAKQSTKPEIADSSPVVINTPASAFLLDKAKPLDPSSFPNPPRRENGNLPCTIPNVDFLLRSYRITVRYNVIKKRTVISIPGLSGSPDNASNSALTQIISLALLNGMSVGHLPITIESLADRNLLNPAADWITCKPWDGIDRLKPFYNTLTERVDFPINLKEMLLYRWLISVVAAALKPSGFKSRGVLTLQGPQSIGKTAWIGALVDDPTLNETLLKLNHHLDASNKDSIISAVCHWIVELGELDSSFRKDLARLKGFLTDKWDKVRRPYAMCEAEYPRRTVFCASVNESNFLIDPTGNTRFWTIPVTLINYKHEIDMQQLFAQVVVEYNKGERWWLEPSEEQELESFNKAHRSISVIQEKLLAVIDTERANDDKLPAYTAVQMLKEIGIDNPTNPQCKECYTVLRELFGEPKRIRGLNKWRIALLSDRPLTGPIDNIGEDKF